MAKPPPGTTPQQQAEFYHVGRLGKHLLLCAGPDCVESAAGEASWAYLKRRVQELGLAGAPWEVFRTKCHCLRICTAGPILVVYPEGVWYRGATPEVIERVLREHVMEGKVVEAYVFARDGLGGAMKGG